MSAHDRDPTDGRPGAADDAPASTAPAAAHGPAEPQGGNDRPNGQAPAGNGRPAGEALAGSTSGGDAPRAADDRQSDHPSPSDGPGVDDPSRSPAEDPGVDDPPPASGERRLGMAMVAALIATGTLLLWHGAWDDPAWWMTAPFVAVWCCVPYAWAGRTLRAARGAPAPERLAGWGVLAMVALALLVLGSYHAADEPGRGGRVFMLLPVWQGLVFVPFYLLARWLRPAAAGRR